MRKLINMGTDQESFLKGVTVILGVMVACFAAWAAYTQNNRFTWEDGERHEARMLRIEERDRALENKYDDIALHLERIEGSLKTIQWKIDNK